MSAAERACVILMLVAGSLAIVAFLIWFLDGVTS